MATYLEMKVQAEALSKEVEAARQSELQTVVNELRAKIAEYGITKRDIFGTQRARSTKTPTPPKYRDPKTGGTWSGRGRPPEWIKNAKNRDRYLIKE